MALVVPFHPLQRQIRFNGLASDAILEWPQQEGRKMRMIRRLGVRFTVAARLFGAAE